MFRIIIFCILTSFFISLTSVEAKKNDDVRIGAFLGMNFPTSSFNHEFNPSLTYGLNATYAYEKKRHFELTLGMIDWQPGDNPGVENLSYSMTYLHFGYNWLFKKEEDGFYVGPRFGVLFRNYTYKTEEVESKSDNMIWTFGLKTGYLYPINDGFYINAAAHCDLGIRNSSESAAFTDEGEIMFYYGISIGIMYGF